MSVALEVPIHMFQVLHCLFHCLSQAPYSRASTMVALILLGELDGMRGESMSFYRDVRPESVQVLDAAYSMHVHILDAAYSMHVKELEKDSAFRHQCIYLKIMVRVEQTILIIKENWKEKKKVNPFKRRT